MTESLKVRESKRRTVSNTDPYTQLDNFILKELVPLHQYGSGKSVEEVKKKSQAQINSKINELLQLMAAPVPQQNIRSYMWNRLFTSFMIIEDHEQLGKIAGNTQCLIFSKLLSEEYFDRWPKEVQQKFLDALTNFYGKPAADFQKKFPGSTRTASFAAMEEFRGVHEDQIPYNIVAKDGDMTASLQQLNGLVSKFCRDKGAETRSEISESIQFLNNRIVSKEVGQDGLQDVPLGDSPAPEKQKPSEKKQGDELGIEILTVPSNSAYFWAGLWRFVMLPLSILEGFARAFDKLAEKAWQDKDKHPLIKIGAGALQGVNHLSLQAFAPEVLIQRYPKRKNWIRAGNSAAWIGLGICVPPLCAKILPKFGLSLPFVEMGKMSTVLESVANLSAEQTFWMTLMFAAYGVRQILQFIGEKYFDWGGKPAYEAAASERRQVSQGEIPKSNQPEPSTRVSVSKDLYRDPSFTRSSSSNSNLGSSQSLPSEQASSSVSNNPMGFGYGSIDRTGGEGPKAPLLQRGNSEPGAGTGTVVDPPSF